MRVVVGVLALSLIAVVRPEGQTRLDDELLLVVAKRRLKEFPDVQCVRGPYLDKSQEGISDWLFERLRRSRRLLKRCKGAATFDDSTELMLGPVRWTTPNTHATVYYGFPLSVNGQPAFYAEVDALGRWHFVRVAME